MSLNGIHSNSLRLNVGSTVITQLSTPPDGAQNPTRSFSWLFDAIIIALGRNRCHDVLKITTSYFAFDHLNCAGPGGKERFL